MRILIIEDQQKLATYTKKGLENEGYVADCVYDGEAGLQRAIFGEYDAIILDVMLPKKDGIAVCQELREREVMTPIVMVTAKSDVDDRIAGLDSGADDYLIKPYAFEELVARIRVLLRRPQVVASDVIKLKKMQIDVQGRTVHVDGHEIVLTLKEFCVLEYLARSTGQVITREQILDHCWGYDYDGFSNIVDVYIKRLRNKIKKHIDEEVIETLRGVGYTIAH